MWLPFCSGHSLSYLIRIGGLSFPPVIDLPLAGEESKTRDKLTWSSLFDGLSLTRKRRIQPLGGCGIKGLDVPSVRSYRGLFPPGSWHTSGGECDLNQGQVLLDESMIEFSIFWLISYINKHGSPKRRAMWINSGYSYP